MIGFKQYIISLMSIFLSLTLGIFIGNAVLDNDLVIAQQQEIIGRLEGNYSALQQEYRNLQAQISLLDLFHSTEQCLEKVLLPSLVKESLEARVAIVCINGKKLDAQLLSFLQDLGVKIEMVMNLSDNFYPDNKQLMQTLIKEYRHGREGANLNWQELIEYLAGVVTGSRDDKLLGILVAGDWITYTGNAFSGVDMVLLYGGGSHERSCPLDDLEVILLSAWQKDRMRVGIIENTGSDPAYLSFFLDQKVALIDHIDSLAGRISLLFFLQGNDSGYYGVGEHAQAILPMEWLQGLIISNGTRN
ncbi:MAG: copper transporter [bacterium]|jgi:hypothetical protein